MSDVQSEAKSDIKVTETETGEAIVTFPVEKDERLGRDPSVLKRHLKRGRCRRLLSYTNCEPFRIRITTRGTRSLARHRSGR